jgi:hypothetical protein
MQDSAFVNSERIAYLGVAALRVTHLAIVLSVRPVVPSMLSSFSSRTEEE